MLLPTQPRLIWPQYFFFSNSSPAVSSLLTLFQTHWVWWLISCINLIGPQGVQAFGQTLFWVTLRAPKSLQMGQWGEGDDRGWDGWMASLTRWMWVWVNSGSWWWTGRPGVLWFMGLQRVGHDWATDLIWSVRVFLDEVNVWLSCVSSLPTACLGAS